MDDRDEKASAEAVVETVERLGDDTVRLLQEVCESLRDSLEQVQWRWHHIENRLAALETELRKPAADASKAAVRFGTELRRTSAEVLGTLRTFGGTGR